MIHVGALVSFLICATAAACVMLVASTEIIPESTRPLLVACALGLILVPALSVFTKRGSGRRPRKCKPAGLAGAMLVEAERAFREHGYFKQARFSALYMAMHFRVSTDVAKTALRALASDGWLIRHREDWGSSYELPDGRKRAIIRDYGLPPTWDKPVVRDLRRQIRNVSPTTADTRVKAIE